MGGEGHNTLVLDHVPATDAVFAAEFVERIRHAEREKIKVSCVAAMANRANTHKRLTPTNRKCFVNSDANNTICPGVIFSG